jgi:hypothetical protein
VERRLCLLLLALSNKAREEHMKKKTKDQVSMDLNLSKYVRVDKLKKALLDAGCVLPHDDFESIIDIHMRILFHRYAPGVAARQGPIMRADMSREMRILLSGKIYTSPDGQRFIKRAKDYDLIWTADFYKHNIKKNLKTLESKDEGHTLFKILNHHIQQTMTSMRSSYLKQFIPRSLKLRKGGRDTLSFIFTKGQPVRVCWPDQIPKDRHKGVRVDVKLTALADVLLAMDDVVLVDALCEDHVAPVYKLIVANPNVVALINNEYEGINSL